ncbi:HAMP domain-containing histidine kinase [Patescibacteria group bacterium]|nr:HAMP domain-containing histidine kinase [Patescibacteria group bacterium]MBU1868765.1 HAMP domain-containing histidine kinase [Patescibacteria group bacterium]
MFFSLIIQGVKTIFNKLISGSPEIKDSETLSKVKLMNITVVILLGYLFVWTGVYLFNPAFNNRGAQILYVTVCFVGVYIWWRFKSSDNVKLYATVYNVVLTGTLILNSMALGIAHSGTFALFIVPAAAFFVGGTRAGLTYGGIVMAWLLLAGVLGNLRIAGDYVSTEFVMDLLVTYLLAAMFLFAYERLRRLAYERLSRKNKELQRFVYAVSHDLRSPLTSLRGYLDEMRDSLQQGDGEQLFTDMDNTEKLAFNMGQMIDDLLALSRVGKEEYKREELSVGQIVRKVLSDTGIQLKEKGFQVEIRTEMPVLGVYARPLEQVFSNLISNAIKFTEDKANPMIAVGCAEKENEYWFYVEDNGVGVPAGEQEKIFDLFYRSGTKAGSGIGLSIVKEYVDLHGGRVWVDSEEGKGSTFWFSVPKE